MSVSIISGASSDVQTIDPTSKAARVTLYNTSGSVLGTDSNPIKTGEVLFNGTFVGDYLGSTYRSVGAAGLQNLASFWNPVGSGRVMAMRRIIVQTDHTTLLATTLHAATSTVSVQPTGGTAGLIFKADSTYGNSSIEMKGLASADGTNGTAITATPVTRVFQQFIQRAHTLAGWFTTDDLFMIPERSFDVPIILRAGEGILVHTLQNATTGAFYLVNARWNEYTV